MEFIVCAERLYDRGAYLHQWLLAQQIGDMDDKRCCEVQLICVNDGITRDVLILLISIMKMFSVIQ